MSWYLQTGKESDVVMQSQVILARNLSQFNFYIKEEEKIAELENLLQESMLQIGYDFKFFKLREIDNITLQTFVEKGLITNEIFQKKNEVSLLINEEENICIIINYEDNLKLQVFSSGLELEAVSNLCIEIDEKLQTILNISKNSKYGYLTACPTNIGTGMKLLVTLHLPGLSQTNNIQKLIKFVRQFGIEISKEQNPDIYEISNERTLGITEQDIIKNIKMITEKIIEQERSARKILTESQIELEDEIHRSYGILSNCKKISQKEAEELLSKVKLGTDLGILSELTDSKVKKLYLYIKPANLRKYFGQDLSHKEENIKRAQIIKNITKD